MDKNQFLTILRQSLSSELPEGDIDNNINFYKEYIESALSQQRTESDVLEELGDPRLIARTILDTHKRSKESILGGFKEQKRAQYQEDSQRESRRENGNREVRQSVSRIFTIVLVVLFFLTFGRFIIAMAFSILIPLLVLFVFVSLIIGIFRR